MHRIFLAVLSTALLLSCTPRENTLTRAEKADGWQLLFDGETLAGWRSFNETALLGESWVVVHHHIARRLRKRILRTRYQNLVGTRRGPHSMAR